MSKQRYLLPYKQLFVMCRRSADGKTVTRKIIDVPQHFEDDDSAKIFDYAISHMDSNDEVLVRFVIRTFGQLEALHASLANADVTKSITLNEHLSGIFNDDVAPEDAELALLDSLRPKREQIDHEVKIVLNFMKRQHS